MRYLLAPLVAFLPIVGFLIGWSGDNRLLAAYFTPFVIFVCVPILDWVIGRDSVNPERSELVELTSDRFYRALTALCLPLYSATLLFGLWVLVTQTLSSVETIGWILSIGLIGGVVAINPAHELIHKSNPLNHGAVALMKTIPYPETRDYIQRVLDSYVIYSLLYPNPSIKFKPWKLPDETH
ncbi:hypothetical protein EBR57_07185 [bacterium]|nr:hypothetical protein [bacterium]